MKVKLNSCFQKANNSSLAERLKGVFQTRKKQPKQKHINVRKTKDRKV